MKKHIGIWLELGKVRIAVLTTLSALTGYILAANGLAGSAVSTVVGVFVLACGAAALNQWQEQDIDGLMIRTQNRPLPSGRVTRRYVLFAATAMIGAGLALLWFNPAAAMLGALTVIWYNGIYTPLKKMTAFAAIPGGVVGSIPPVIGWVAGGGEMTDPRILAVAFFFFVWQVPHFWLLLLRIGDDYERAGLPTLTALFSRRQLTRVTYAWMLATGASCVLLVFFGVSAVVWVNVGLLLASVWLAWHATAMVRSEGATLAFKEINVYALIVITLLSVSGLVS